VKILVALAVGLVVWIVLWALGTKAFDGFMITIALVLIAVVVQLTEPLVQKYLRP
jgi:hypothetical protein